MEGLGYDVKSHFGDPKLNANGTLQAGSPAIGFAPTQTFFNDDFNRNIRTERDGRVETGDRPLHLPQLYAFNLRQLLPRPLPTPTPVPVAVPTPLPIPLPTPIPSPTQVPTQLPTPTPSPTPPIEGMWNVSGTVIKTQSGFRIDLLIED